MLFFSSLFFNYLKDSYLSGSIKTGGRTDWLSSYRLSTSGTEWACQIHTLHHSVPNVLTDIVQSKGKLSLISHHTL